MKTKLFLVVVSLVVSLSVIFGVKVYNYHSMTPLMRANLEALTDMEDVSPQRPCYVFFKYFKGARLKICKGEDACFYLDNASYDPEYRDTRECKYLTY
ncbi:MAG: hypothetical protein IIX03_00425 [Paludibacteraceae bacterium]|nr:hypothetical protein [Paludibacteraceae bacterium]